MLVSVRQGARVLSATGVSDIEECLYYSICSSLQCDGSIG